MFFFGAFAFEVVRAVREEEPELVDDQFRADVCAMLDEASYSPSQTGFKPFRGKCARS